MAKQRIQLVQVEHIIDKDIDPTFRGDRAKFVALGGNLEYRALCSPQHLDPTSACLYGVDPFSIRMRELWERSNSDRAFVPCGEVTLRDFIYFGDCGLPIDFTCGIALVGAPVNWGVDFARWYIRQHAAKVDYLTWCDDGDAFVLDVDIEAIPIETDLGLMLASPGQNIFGHWILDYIPRIFLARQIDPKWWANLYIGELPKWSEHFLRVFDIDASAIRILPDRPLTRFSSVAMPSGVKQGFRVSQPINERAWRYLKSSMDKIEIENERELPAPRKVFVRRQSWGAGRVISNRSRLEKLAVDRGFDVISPEDYSIREQAKIFRSTRIVIGEDGSGLHNIVFTDPGSVLGVISVQDRPNLWHMAICQAMGHRLSYIAADPFPGGIKVVAERSFVAFLDLLEDMAASHPS